MDQLSRRRILAATGAVASAIAVGACSEPSGSTLARSKPGSDSSPPDATPTPLAAVSDLSAEPTETVDPATGDRAFLVKGPDGVSMLSAICTHMGCAVEWHASSDEFVCPCHGATYDATGEVVGGPAPRSLSEIPVVVRGGQVYPR